MKETYSRTGSSTTLDLAWLERLRKDFLTLMKNLPKVKDYETAIELSEAFNIFKNRFSKLFFERFLNTDLKYQYESFGITEDDAKYIDKKLRTISWNFYVELDVPIIRADTYYSKEARFRQFEEALPNWETRVRKKAQVFWKEMKEVIEWMTRHKPLTVNEPDEEQVVLEGFRVLVRGRNLESTWITEAIETFKEGLRIYKRNAGTRLPVLLKHQLPLILECEAALEKAGTYNHNGTISFYASTLVTETPERAAHILAHEMGHHMWRLLDGGAREFWTTALEGDYGDLDIEELLRKWPSDAWAFDMLKYMSESDPILGLQVETLHNSPSYSRLDTKEDFERLLASGVRTIKVPKTPISGYAGKSPEEAFCEAIGLIVAYGPRAVHERIRNWLDIVMPGSIVTACVRVVRRFTSYRK